MALTKKLLHTRMRVDDLERTVDFYKTILGLEEVEREVSPRGSQLVFLRTPGSEELLEITYYPASGPVKVQADLMHLAFEIEDLAAFEAHLAAHGLAFSDGPHVTRHGSRIAFIDAPEGYEIELIQKAKE